MNRELRTVLGIGLMAASIAVLLTRIDIAPIGAAPAGAFFAIALWQIIAAKSPWAGNSE